MKDHPSHYERERNERSLSPQPFTAVGGAKVTTNWVTIGALVALVFAAGGVYVKMPSADQITALDAKHTEALKALDEKHAQAEARLQGRIDEHAQLISRMSGQVGFLVRIEVAKAKQDDDPSVRRALRQAAAEAQTSAAKPPANVSADPLAGIDLE